MGFLSILLLIAIAADDVFVFYDTFERIKVEYADEGLEVWALKKCIFHTIQCGPCLKIGVVHI